MPQGRRCVTGLIALLLLACAACSAPVRPLPEPEATEALSPWRGRLVRAALTEWRAWGELVVEGWPEALPQPADPDNYTRILDYWSSTPEGPAVASRLRNTHDSMMLALLEATPPGAPPPQPSISLWAYPAWSAAFVSAVLQRAGVPPSVFPAAAAHAWYIDRLLSEAAWNPSGAAFLPHDPAGYAAAPGDLLCADRSRLPLLHWQDRLAEAGQFRPLHCDIVVAAGGGLVQAVGGNVLDATVLRRFPADSRGHVLPPPFDKPPFFLVFENRLDRMP